MKSFLWKFLLFIAPLVIFLIATELYVTLSPNTFSTKSDYLKNNLNDIEILILGSSHNQNAINPRYLSLKAANLAYGGQDLFLDSQLLNRYLVKLTRLKLVFIELSYHTLEHKNQQNYWRNSYYLRYHGISTGETRNLINWSIFLSNPVFFFQYILRKINPYSYKYLINEFGFIENDFRLESEPVWINKVESQHDTESVQNYQTNSNLIDDMISICKHNSIEVFFISPPVHETYASKMVIDKIQRREDFLMRHKEVLFLNYEHADQFDGNDFKNYDHLSSSGAIKFTEILDKQILSLIADRQ